MERRKAEMVSSLDAMEEEMQNQIVDLPRFASQLKQRHAPRLDAEKTVFAGSGDSYAAALFAQELTGGAALAADPYELYLKPKIAKGKHAVLISVSGRTKANLDLARRLKRVARKRIAVTANPVSPLAGLCDQRLVLQYRRAGRLTSGTVSFTTSLLACAHLLRKLPEKLALRAAMRRAASWAKVIRVPPDGAFYFIGSGVNRAHGEYGACKVQEVLGAKALAQVPEQLGHAQLFPIDKGKDVIFCIPRSPKDPTWKVLRVLDQNGFRVHSTTGQSRNVVLRSLEISFHLQHLALNLARRKGLKECSFLTNRSRLQLSNRLIY